MIVTGPENETGYHPQAENSAPIPQSPGDERRLPLAWLAIPLLLLAVVVLAFVKPTVAYPLPYVLMGLNLFFLTLVSLVICYLLARTFLLRGTPALLLLGCGVLMWAFSAAGAALASKEDVNVYITIHNSGAFVAAVCHVSGALMFVRKVRRARTPGLWLTLGYGFAAGVVVLLAGLAWEGKTPLFFVQGQGGTALRQVALGTSVVMFVVSAVLLGGKARHPYSPFFYWYSLALGLIAVGLFGVMTQASAGSLLGWVGRGSQYLGGVYMLVAALASVRESGLLKVPLEAALEESNERFKALAAATFEGIAVTEAGFFTDANDQFLDMIGYSREEVLGMEIGRLVPAADRQRVLENIRRGRESWIEHEVVRKDGRVIVVEAHGRNIQYQGRSVRFTAIRDITERKRMEDKLRNSERLYRAIGESIDYGVWVCAPDGRNIYASESFLKLVGLTQEQCSEFGWGSVLHPDDAERTISAWKECVRTGGKWDVEHRFRGVDGQWHYILARGVPVYDQQGKISCWAGIDLDISSLKSAQARLEETGQTLQAEVTERKEAERALQQAQTALKAHADDLEKIVARRTSKLQEAVAELEHFSYAIAHDLRAPLRAMQGFADLLQDECNACPSNGAAEYMRRIRVAASRMDELITDSLDYSKAARQELTLAPVDLVQLLNGMVETYPNLQPEKADIQISSELPPVLGNEAALTQCFSNLLGNAVKFAKAETKAHIRIWAEAPTPVSQGGGAKPGSARVRVWVEDDGIGIPQESLDRIFGLFQRATTTYEGTGLGLAIVRKVAQRMGGEVGVESELGKGSRFWVDLAKAP